jgi:hypothetical protein
MICRNALWGQSGIRIMLTERYSASSRSLSSAPGFNPAQEDVRTSELAGEWGQGHHVHIILDTHYLIALFESLCLTFFK